MSFPNRFFASPKPLPLTRQAPAVLSNVAILCWLYKVPRLGGPPRSSSKAVAAGGRMLRRLLQKPFFSAVTPFLSGVRASIVATQSEPGFAPRTPAQVPVLTIDGR